MIEAIAHLINRDYSMIGDDFVNMDFIPRGVDAAPSPNNTLLINYLLTTS